MDSNLVKMATDYLNTAMIFQHGRETVVSKMAVRLIITAVALKPPIPKKFWQKLGAGFKYST